MSDSRNKLTPKQAQFVNEYLLDLNATQAAIRAGYSEKTAYSIGIENLNKPVIKNAIEIAMQKRSERTEVNADWLLKRLADEADADIADLYDESTGALKPVHKWPKIWRQGLVAGIDVNQLKVGDQVLGDVVKLKLADRNAKLRMIGDHIGVQAFRQNVQHSGNMTIEALLDELIK